MCVIVDTNTLTSVFDKTSSDHKDFQMLFQWIEGKQGIFVYGGTKYRKELSQLSKIVNVIKVLSRQNKTFHVNDDDVDEYEKKIIEKTAGTQCDDQHIIALVNVSKCQLICTNDKRAFVFFRDASLYDAGVNVPSIFHQATSIKGKKNLIRNNGNQIKLRKSIK